MSTAQQLANRLQEVYLNGTWIANTNWQDQLNQTSYEQATQQVDSLNTIAALTYHITYYLQGVLNVLEGGDLEIKDKYSFDCPTLENEDDWNILRADLTTTAKHFVEAVSQLTQTELNSNFVDPKYGTYARNLEAIIEHSYYHLAQVVILRKII